MKSQLEFVKSLTSPQISSRIRAMNGHTSITIVESVNFNDKLAVERQINDFAKKYAFANVEHARIISPNGNAYTLRGIGEIVDPTFIGDDALRGSIVIHNHPPYPWGEPYDSFSVDDLGFASRHNQMKHYLVSGVRRNSFEFTKTFTEDVVYDAWDNAESIMVEEAFDGLITIINRQEEILKILNRELEGFAFYENF